MRSEDEALAAFGLEREAEPADAHYDVWPENWPAVQVFAGLMTQWNVSMAGPTGLRYEAIPVVLRMRGVPRGEWSEVFYGLQVMEAEALKHFAEKRNG